MPLEVAIPEGVPDEKKAQLRFLGAEVIEAHELYVASRGEEDQGTRNCVKALADLYDEWAKAAPGRGYEDRAEEWKAVVAAS